MRGAGLHRKGRGLSELQQQQKLQKTGENSSTGSTIVTTFQVSKHACYQQHGAFFHRAHDRQILRPEQDCLGSNSTCKGLVAWFTGRHYHLGE